MSKLKIDGIQTIDGGTYEDIKVDGCLKCLGDISCTSLDIGGISSFKANLNTGSLDVDGKITVEGNIEANSVEIDGLAKIKGSLKANNIEVDGKLSVEDSIEGELIDLEGLLTVNGDCTVENFISEGKSDINGLLNAGTVDISIAAKCYIKEIGGDKVMVREGNRFMKLITNLIVGKTLVTETIEADEIYLENTKAEIVRGNSVTIGRNCDIKTVEYKEDFKLEGNGYVGNSVLVK